jgi:hypothetical protein
MYIVRTLWQSKITCVKKQEALSNSPESTLLHVPDYLNLHSKFLDCGRLPWIVIYVISSCEICTWL